MERRLQLEGRGHFADRALVLAALSKLGAEQIMKSRVAGVSTRGLLEFGERVRGGHVIARLEENGRTKYLRRDGGSTPQNAPPELNFRAPARMNLHRDG